jgi:hypothetical protein
MARQAANIVATGIFALQPHNASLHFIFPCLQQTRAGSQTSLNETP